MSSISTSTFFWPLDPRHPGSWPGYKLLMPVCAVGNIGQLACDLIISTLLSRKECRLIGRIYSPAVKPVVGPNAFSTDGPVTTSTEVYESEVHRLVIIQQRTSYFKKLRQIYINQLVQWIKISKFDHVLVLASSFAQCNPDTSQLGDLNALPIKTVTTSMFKKNDTWLDLKLKTLPDKEELNVVKDGLPYLLGSGLTKRLKKAFEEASIPAAFIIDFCSEGINLHDCYQVVSVVDGYLKLSHPESESESRVMSSIADLRAAIQDVESGLDESGDAPDVRYGFSVSSHRFWVVPYSWKRAYT